MSHDALIDQISWMWHELMKELDLLIDDFYKNK